MCHISSDPTQDLMSSYSLVLFGIFLCFLMFCKCASCMFRATKTARFAAVRRKHKYLFEKQCCGYLSIKSPINFVTCNSTQFTLLLSLCTFIFTLIVPHTVTSWEKICVVISQCRIFVVVLIKGRI